MKTDFEFNAQVDSLTKASSKNADSLKKLGDMKSAWRAAAHDPEKRQTLCDELDAVAVTVKGEQAKPAAPAPAAKPAV